MPGKFNIPSCFWCEHAIIAYDERWRNYIEDCKSEYLSDEALDLLFIEGSEVVKNREEELAKICGNFTPRIFRECKCGKQIDVEEYKWPFWSHFWDILPVCQECYREEWYQIEKERNLPRCETCKFVFGENEECVDCLVYDRYDPKLVIDRKNWRAK